MGDDEHGVTGAPSTCNPEVGDVALPDKDHAPFTAKHQASWGIAGVVVGATIAGLVAWGVATATASRDDDRVLATERRIVYSEWLAAAEAVVVLQRDAVANLTVWHASGEPIDAEFTERFLEGEQDLEAERRSFERSLQAVRLLADQPLRRCVELYVDAVRNQTLRLRADEVNAAIRSSGNSESGFTMTADLSEEYFHVENSLRTVLLEAMAASVGVGEALSPNCEIEPPR